jgi:site-specific DNA recombinase
MNRTTKRSTKTGPTRYATYSRCSTDDQKHNDFSTTDVQRDLNAQHVHEKGGVLIGAYQDDGISGTTLKRPDWNRLLADAQANKFDAVVVTYMSRLGRGNAFVNAEYELGKCGVRVEMAKENFTEDMAGHVNKQMTNLMDGMYPKMVSGWTKTKQQAMVKAGYFAGGVPMFGYQKEVVTHAAGFHSAGKEPPKRLS